jgi:hypothetical protein
MLSIIASLPFPGTYYVWHKPQFIVGLTACGAEVWGAALWQTTQLSAGTRPDPKWHHVQWRLRQLAVWVRGAVSLWHRMQ